MPVIQRSPDKAFTPVILGLFTGVTALTASEFIPGDFHKINACKF